MTMCYEVKTYIFASEQILLVLYVPSKAVLHTYFLVQMRRKKENKIYNSSLH